MNRSLKCLPVCEVRLLDGGQVGNAQIDDGQPGEPGARVLADADEQSPDARRGHHEVARQLQLGHHLGPLGAVWRRLVQLRLTLAHVTHGPLQTQ